MRDLSLELRHNLDQNSDTKASEQPASIKHTDSFRCSLQDTPYKEEGRTKNKSSSPAERVAVSSTEGPKKAPSNVSTTKTTLLKWNRTHLQ
jgi:hypothetical protein